MGANKDIGSLLQPFEERAQMAEERLAKLEAAAQQNQGSSGREDLLQSLTELRKKLVGAKAEQEAEKQKLIDENKKLQYQVLHLKRAVGEADAKLAAAEAKLPK
ncbi:uncharacterized protein [Physcomitrium patens]|uniref:Uncharacterized protein n=1 Tax=Physcomitrium patens TaxID=3218 RepID=A9T8Y3_PHYPA|nr:uncharacterized protein LOC112295069 [Physcomitrium patens]PNR34919.1 hypothetical protein PHYPA_022818 [Physcomitrium patens]|eukprot:XP_024401981.1 uncharacterized protein LOC112295069 [Physcomitrella patens]